MFSTSGPRRSQRKLQVPNLDRVLFASKQRRRHVQDSLFPGTDLKNIYIIIKKIICSSIWYAGGEIDEEGA